MENKRVIDFNSLSLKQKIAQMIIIRAEIPGNYNLVREGIGGIFLDKQKSAEKYAGIINKYKKNSKIDIFVATDMEGAWNPFRNFKNFPKFSQVETKEQAFKVGLEQGLFLKRLGFNLNFSPVAEYNDLSFGGRVFCGTQKEIKEKLIYYINGLQKNVLGTCKHYPGRGMIKNLHFRRDKQVISKEDLLLFHVCFKNNVKGVMIGHQIAKGVIDSKSRPSSVSKNVIDSLKDFKGLIFSDEINMFGLTLFYLFDKKRKYRDLINAGGNIILDFRLTSWSFNRLYKKLEKDIKSGFIYLKNIDHSVKKILIAKGYKVI